MQKNYTIIFDNNCGVCDLTVRSLKATRFLGDEQLQALETHKQNVLACNVDPQRACDEMAVVNNDTKEVQYGVDAYLGILAGEFWVFRFLKKISGIKLVLKPIYTFIASNRRVIAPKVAGEEICKPTLNVGNRLALLVLLSFFSVIVTYLKGEALSGYDEFEFLNGWKLLGITGPGWLIVALLYKEKDRWEYWGHLAVIAGIAIFFQSLALLGYKLITSVYWVVGSMLLTDLLMLYMHYNRMKILGKSQVYTLKWWLVLHGTAALVTIMYLI